MYFYEWILCSGVPVAPLTNSGCCILSKVLPKIMYVVQIKLNLLRLNLKFIPICLFSSCANSTICVLLCVFCMEIWNIVTCSVNTSFLINNKHLLTWNHIKQDPNFLEYIFFFSNKQQTSLNLEQNKTGPSLLGTNTDIHLGAISMVVALGGLGLAQCCMVSECTLDWAAQSTSRLWLKSSHG